MVRVGASQLHPRPPVRWPPRPYTLTGTKFPPPPQTLPPHSNRLSHGQPLDASTRTYFEPRFGHDFSRVQVHSGSPVHDEAAAAVNAKAFTVGHHLVFAQA